MSTRNPMNERYQSEKPKGTTKKSAASAKPKSKAAASVHIQSTGKTKKEKKDIEKKERERQRAVDSVFYNPDTERYKKLRRLWWILLIAAVVMTVVVFVAQSNIPTWLSSVCLVLAYGCIFGALYVDLVQIRRERRRYQDEMMRKNPNLVKEINKQVKAEQKESDAKAAAKPSTGSGLGGLFGKKKDAAEKEDK